MIDVTDLETPFLDHKVNLVVVQAFRIDNNIDEIVKIIEPFGYSRSLVDRKSSVLLASEGSHRKMITVMPQMIGDLKTLEPYTSRVVSCARFSNHHWIIFGVQP